MSVHTMLIEYRLWATRSKRSVELKLLGTSPLPSPAGVAQVPAALPLGSGHVGFFGSLLFPEKYGGRAGVAADAVGLGGGLGVAGFVVGAQHRPCPNKRQRKRQRIAPAQ